MCRIPHASKSGYYDFEKDPMSHRTMEYMALLEQIKVTHEDFQRPYGSPADVRTWNQSQEVQRSHGCQSGRSGSRPYPDSGKR